MKAVIIPVRYGSTRFPGKPLALLSGRPLIQHVYERSTTASLVDEVIVATDSEEILKAVISFGGRAEMTSPAHSSGTDRIAEVAKRMDYDIIVNVQGDEPLIRGDMIDDVVRILEDREAGMGTLARVIEDMGEIFNPNVVKVVFDQRGFAHYFSRAPIPFYRDEFKGLEAAGHGLQVNKKIPGISEKIKQGTSDMRCFKHIGIYSYHRDVLLRLTGLPQSVLERAEQLEQLRALDNGVKIKVGLTDHETIGVDTPEDLERVEKWLNLYL